MTILNVANGKALIYIYRSGDLEKVLMRDGVRNDLPGQDAAAEIREDKGQTFCC